MTPPPRPRRARSTFWLGALLLLAVILGSAWLARSLSDRGLSGNPAMNPGMPPMPGMTQQDMPGMQNGMPPSSP
ncbi:hypothetical protein [Deinococcus geothermalis]|uniref:hypothetical protein n=1 Tax=Deinococcus geothermalis TaxID=68909 RepID=UPI0023559CB9|nr:hypothetical protein [Deinococcus geothermalis]